MRMKRMMNFKTSTQKPAPYLIRGRKGAKGREGRQTPDAESSAVPDNTKSPSKNNLNIVHLAYERHAALQNACVASHTARSAPCLASRLQAAICPSYSCSAPKGATGGGQRPCLHESSLTDEDSCAYNAHWR